MGTLVKNHATAEVLVANNLFLDEDICYWARELK